MSEDIDYLANYVADKLYVHPARDGAFATIVGDSKLVGELNITPRCKLAVRAFYVREKADFNSLKIVKMKYSRGAWIDDGFVQVNKVQASQMIEFLSLLAHLDLSDAKKSKISLDSVHVDALSSVLSSSKGAALLKELAEAPELHQDIYAVATKRNVLADSSKSLDRA